MLSNREGTSVDPVPFLVVTGLSFLICLSVGPLYLNAVFGISFATGVGWSFLVFTGLLWVSWYRFVWTRRPRIREEVPAERRLRGIYYGMVAFGLVVALMLLPLW